MTIDNLGIVACNNTTPGRAIFFSMSKRVDISHADKNKRLLAWYDKVRAANPNCDTTIVDWNGIEALPGWKEDAAAFSSCLFGQTHPHGIVGLDKRGKSECGDRKMLALLLWTLTGL